MHDNTDDTNEIIFDLEFRLALEDANGDLVKLQNFLLNANKAAYILFAQNFVKAAGLLGVSINRAHNKPEADLEPMMNPLFYIIAKGGWKVFEDLVRHPEKVPYPLPLPPLDFQFHVMMIFIFMQRFGENLEDQLSFY